MKSKANLFFAGWGGLFLLLASSCTDPPAQVEVVRPVKVMTVGAAGIGGERVFPGVVQASQRARLSFRVSGPLVQLPVFQGQEVKKGQLLAQIDPRDFQNTVTSLEARLAELRAQLDAMKQARPEDIRTLEANLEASRARLLEADATFRRYQRLYERDNVSKAEYDQRRAARDVATAEVRSAQESLRVGQIGARAEDVLAQEARIRAMESDVQQARDRVADTSLIATYDGIVAQTFVENFEYVQAREEIVSLQDVSVVEIVTQIPEVFVGRSKRGQLLDPGEIPQLEVRFESIPDRFFPAKPTEISAQADPVTRTYAITLQTPQPEGAVVLAGMTAEVRGKDSSDTAMFQVPLSAVFADETGTQKVWVFDEQAQTAQEVEVEVGEMIGDQAIILAGLNLGDVIVTAGSHAISEGQKLRKITDELRERR